MLIVEYDIYIVRIMNKWDEAEYIKIMLEVDFFFCSPLLWIISFKGNWKPNASEGKYKLIDLEGSY